MKVKIFDKNNTTSTENYFIEVITIREYPTVFHLYRESSNASIQFDEEEIKKSDIARIEITF